jgi:hypothetical protein
MPTPGTLVGTDVGLSLGRDISFLETPETIPDLAAWYDARDPDYFTLTASGGVAAWANRALDTEKSVGLAPLLQGTTASQPVYTRGLSTTGNQNAVVFDGVDDELLEATAAKWSFMHDNTGFTIFYVRRIDSTGPAFQTFYSTCSASTAQRGAFVLYRDTPLCQVTCGNGSGAWLFDSNLNAAGLSTRNVTAWQTFSYGGGVATARATGVSQNATVTAGTPSLLAPEYGLKLGRCGTSFPFKGAVPQVLVYKRFLTVAEILSLGAWSALIYGVAA